MSHWLRTLKARLQFTYLILIVLALGLLIWRLGTWLDESRYAETLRDQEARAMLAAGGTKEMIQRSNDNLIDAASLQQQLHNFSDGIPERLSLFDKSGRLLADSQYVTDQGTVDAVPEVEDALQGRVAQQVRFDPSEGSDAIYTAAPVNELRGLIGVVRLELPMSVFAAERNQRWLQLGGAALLAAMLTGVLSLLFARIINSPLARMTEATAAMTGIDQGSRIHISGPKDMVVLGNALNRMADQVSTSRETQRAFTANAARELATPLSNIRLRIQALRNGALNDQTQAAKFLSEIENEAESLTRLVGGLVELTQIETGITVPRRESVSLPDIARAAAQGLEEQAAAAAVSISVLERKGLPYVKADPDQIQKVYQNLIENSIRFTRPGGAIQVEFSLGTAPAGTAGKLVSRVCDSGEGITAEDLAHIFERFYRSENARTRNANDGRHGSGLGLAIVKAIVESHGGSVWARSDGGKGTIISFAMPID